MRIEIKLFTESKVTPLNTRESVNYGAMIAELKTAVDIQYKKFLKARNYYQQGTHLAVHESIVYLSFIFKI